MEAFLSLYEKFSPRKQKELIGDIHVGDIKCIHEIEDNPEMLKEWERSYRNDIQEYKTYVCQFYITKDLVMEIGNFIKNHGGVCLEVGAGLGVLSHLINSYVDEMIIATDPLKILRKSDIELDYDGFVYEAATRVKTYCARCAIERHDADVLMINWPLSNPPYGIEAITLSKAKYLVYIGDIEGNFHGGNKFHELLSTEWKQIGEIPYENWYFDFAKCRFFERIRG